MIALEGLVGSMLCSGMDKLLIALAVATLLSFDQGECAAQCSDAAGPCKLSSQCLPLVTPSNSTHLLISWKDAFEGCHADHIEEMYIRIIGEKRKAKRHIFVNLSQDNVSLEADPCLQHSFQIQLSFKQSYEDTYERGNMFPMLTGTPKFHYNNEGKNKNYPYGGLLATEVLPEICLMKDGTISIPDPPEPLHNFEISGHEINHVI